MDPALLRERALFKQRAMATPTVEKSLRRPEPPSKEAPSKAKMRPPSSAPKQDSNSYKTMSGSSQYRFGVLAKIVKHMKTRHQDGEDHPLSIDDILDETNQLDIGQSVKTVIQTI